MPLKGDNMMGIKRNNRSAALCVLHENGELSRKRMAETLNLTPAAITKIVGELVEEGLLKEGKSVPSESAGRREIMVQINPHYACALGAFINLGKAMLSAVWLDGSVIFAKEYELDTELCADDAVRLLSQELLKLVEENSLSSTKIVGLGIAVRGIISADGRTVSNSLGALAQEDYPLCQRFEELTGIKAVMTNNVRALFAAQMFLSRDNRSGAQFFLRCEYGIGAALSISGKIWSGVTQQCAEIGHIPVVRRGGRPCVCGKSGCLETVASPSAIAKEAERILSPENCPVLWNMISGRADKRISPDDVFVAARNGDNGAATIVDTAVAALGSALKSVIYLIDPDKIVLYGSIFENEYYMARLSSELHEGVDSSHVTVIEKSRYNKELEDKAAGLLAVNRFINDGGYCD